MIAKKFLLSSGSSVVGSHDNVLTTTLFLRHHVLDGTMPANLFCIIGVSESSLLTCWCVCGLWLWQGLKSEMQSNPNKSEPRTQQNPESDNLIWDLELYFFNLDD